MCCLFVKLLSNKIPDSSNVSLIAHILNPTSLGMSVVDFLNRGGRGPRMSTSGAKSAPNLENERLNSCIQSFEKSAFSSTTLPGNTYLFGWKIRLFWFISAQKIEKKMIFFHWLVLTIVYWHPFWLFQDTFFVLQWVISYHSEDELPKPTYHKCTFPASFK